MFFLHVASISLQRFGYVDRTKNWALAYEAMESDGTVFPGT